MIIIIRIWIRILSRRDSSLLELLDIAIVEEGKLVNNNAAVVAPPRNIFPYLWYTILLQCIVYQRLRTHFFLSF